MQKQGKVRGLEQVEVSEDSKRGAINREKIEECVHFFKKVS